MLTITPISYFFHTSRLTPSPPLHTHTLCIFNKTHPSYHHHHDHTPFYYPSPVYVHPTHSNTHIWLLQIDYPDAQLLHPGQRQSCTPTNLERLMALEQDEVKVSANHRGRSLSEDRSHEDDHEVTLSFHLFLLNNVLCHMLYYIGDVYLPVLIYSFGRIIQSSTSFISAFIRFEQSENMDILSFSRGPYQVKTLRNISRVKEKNIIFVLTFYSFN